MQSTGPMSFCRGQTSQASVRALPQDPETSDYGASCRFRATGGEQGSWLGSDPGMASRPSAHRGSQVAEPKVLPPGSRVMSAGEPAVAVIRLLAVVEGGRVLRTGWLGPFVPGAAPFRPKRAWLRSLTPGTIDPAASDPGGGVVDPVEVGRLPVQLDYLHRVHRRAEQPDPEQLAHGQHRSDGGRPVQPPANSLAASAGCVDRRRGEPSTACSSPDWPPSCWHRRGVGIRAEAATPAWPGAPVEGTNALSGRDARNLLNRFAGQGGHPVPP